MRFINDFSDIRHKTWCYYCNDTLGSTPTNREHIPTKGLLNKPFPKNLPVAEVCKKCNEQYSLDEEYFIAFLSAALSGSTDPNAQVIDSGRKIFFRNKSLQNRIERSKREFQTYGGQKEVLWIAELTRIHSVILKNARGHLFFENGEPMFDQPKEIAVFPLQKATENQLNSFFSNGKPLEFWPEVGSRWMQRLLEEPSFDTNGFYVLQPSVYRFRLDFCNGIAVKSVIHECLATYVAW